VVVPGCSKMASHNIVTYVRFPWLNNVSTAVTMDSTKLLHFLSNVTMETETFQCYMLYFLSNTTIEAETFRLLWRGDIKESWNELVSWNSKRAVVRESLKSSDSGVRERVEFGRRHTSLYRRR
jgi:aspartyl/asparaginyl beta-hydroxylase (cupin superfamily)